MKEEDIKKAKRTSPYVILTAIMTTTFLIFIFFGVNIWKEYKKAVIDTQKDQMLLTAQSIAAGVLKSTTLLTPQKPLWLLVFLCQYFEFST